MDLPQEPEELPRADVVGDLRLVFGSRLPRVGIALGALLEDGVLLRTSSSDLRFPRGRATFARLVCTSLGLITATGGLAVAGALPGPVQHAVSGAADTIGFELPDGGFDLPFGAPPATTAATPTTPEAAPDRRGGADGRSLEIPGFGPIPVDAGTVTTTTVAALPGPAGMTPTTVDGKPHITIGGVWAGVPSVMQTTPTTEPSSPPATPPSTSSSTTTPSSTTSSTVVPPDDGTTTTTPETTPIAPDADLPEP